jgi:hypothetical protein
MVRICNIVRGLLPKNNKVLVRIQPPRELKHIRGHDSYIRFLPAILSCIDSIEVAWAARPIKAVSLLAISHQAQPFAIPIKARIRPFVHN